MFVYFSFHKAGWGCMLIFLKKTTCSSVSVSIVCDNPGHPNRQYVSSLRLQAVGRMPEEVCSIRTPVLPPAPGDSDDVRESAGDVSFHPRLVR